MSVTVSPPAPKTWYSAHSPGHAFSGVTEERLATALLLLCHYWIPRNV